MADYEFILYERKGAAALITLNRPERMNSFNEGLRQELHAALDAADEDPEVRGIILTGAGRAFSAGADMSLGAGGGNATTAWPYGLPENTSIAEFIDGWRTRDRTGIRRLQHMWELSTPVIGAINGWAMGWGSWYAITTHLTYASNQAVFAQPEVRHISNTNIMWTILAGYKNALRYGLTGDHVDAQEAERIGLVNRVIPHDQLLDECFALVERIAKISPETVKANLFVATQGMNMMGLANAWNINAELSALAHTSQREEYKKHLEDAGEAGGMRAYLQERDAPFQPEPFGPRSANPRT